jgi:ribulose-phosphate 3-epimerase
VTPALHPSGASGSGATRSQPGRVLIAASILAADFARLGDAVAAAERGGADWIHVDVMDGRFVPEITIGPVIIEAIRTVTALPIDAHLMVADPERHVDACVRSGATSVTVHVEATPHLQRVIQHIRERGARAAAAINPATPAGALAPVLPDLDMALVMTVNPGYAGQTFIASALPKVREIHAWIEQGGLAVDLQVDGGINDATAGQAVAAGATILVAASAVFKGAGGIEASLARLRRAAAGVRV